MRLSIGHAAEAEIDRDFRPAGWEAGRGGSRSIERKIGVHARGGGGGGQLGPRRHDGARSPWSHARAICCPGPALNAPAPAQATMLPVPGTADAQGLGLAVPYWCAPHSPRRRRRDSRRPFLHAHRLLHLALLSHRSPSDPEGRVTQMIVGDGGCISNHALITALQRRATRVVVFVNADGPITSKARTLAGHLQTHRPPAP